jgi:sterol desaturase/sphingolipid hydroxylase (fatty acid hydroxylase superfamily)
LHGLGKNFDSPWAFHLHEHHAVCVKNAMFDPGYQQFSLFAWNAQTKELSVFVMVILIHLPLLWVYPVFTLILYASLSLYYFKHRKAHLDPVWAKKHLTWHYEHHVNPGSGNWCVTWPWCDYLFGTRNKSS